MGEESQIYAQACAGKFSLIFMSPEALLTDTKSRDMLQNPVYQENLVSFVVDEAHCVTKWLVYCT
jgi:superfamily II DNA helicase RecQ